jgi:ferritin-like metal-binding protein YciE
MMLPLKQPSKLFLPFIHLPSPMDSQALKDLIKQGLAADKAGSKVGEASTADIQNSAKNPDLKAMLDQGNITSKEWAQRIDRAIAEVGGVEERPNEVLEAHYRVSKEISSEAKTDDVRDLGIIASGQLALHYWIASFGTLQDYAQAAGLSQTAQEMQVCVEEAKKTDAAFTALAQKILAAK